MVGTGSRGAGNPKAILTVEEGLSNERIAAKLRIGSNTVINRLDHIVGQDVNAKPHQRCAPRAKLEYHALKLWE